MNRKAIVYYNNVKCGILEELEDEYTFSYDRSYLEKEGSKPVSLTLPLSNEIYRSNILFPFFDGLIPEGWLLEIAINKWKLNRMDRMGLLLSVCEDPIGAVSVEEFKYV